MASALPPSPASPSSKPANTRRTSASGRTTSGPRVEATSPSACRVSAISLARSIVTLSTNSQLAVRTGAWVQAAWHSMRSRVRLPSAVVSSLPTPDVLAERGPQGVAAEDRAEGVRADADVVAALRLALVHRVEGRDGVDLGRRHPAERGAPSRCSRRRGSPRRPGRGAASASAPSAAADSAPRWRAARSAGCRTTSSLRASQRSTPPMTGSIEATAAMTSAIWPPSHIAAVACRFVKDGSR